MSARNATINGLTSANPVAGGETEEEWETFLQGYLEYFDPVGVPEEALVTNMALDVWRKRRIQRYETGLLRTRFEVIQASVPATPVDEQLLIDNVDLELAIGILEGLNELDDSQPLDIEQAEQAALVALYFGCSGPIPDWLPFPQPNWSVADLHQWTGALAEYLGSTPAELVTSTINKARRILGRRQKRLTAQAQQERQALIPNGKVLDLTLRYEAARDRSRHRDQSDLEVLQRTRMGESLPPPIRLEASGD